MVNFLRLVFGCKTFVFSDCLTSGSPRHHCCSANPVIQLFLNETQQLNSFEGITENIEGQSVYKAD